MSGPREGEDVDLDDVRTALLARAFLFEEPGTYAAGVEDAIEAIRHRGAGGGPAPVGVRPAGPTAP